MIDAGSAIREPLDLLLVHPGSARAAYGDLADDLVAVEPPLWCRLIAGYALDRKFSVRILDAEAERKSPGDVALDAFALRPRLVCVVAYGHQPSASTQQMDVVCEIARQIKSACPTKVLVVGGHVSALPERTLRECREIDYVCVGEGPETVVALLEQGEFTLAVIPGLAYRMKESGQLNLINLNESAPLIEDLSLLHGDVWGRLPMERYKAHNWQVLGDLSKRQPYASVHTSLGCPYKCSFCCINAPFQSHRYRMRRPLDVFMEIVRLYDRHGVRTFKIADEMFVLNERHYGEICDRLAAWNRDDNINIWAYARVDTVRADRLRLLRRAGVRWLALGIESESAYVRDGVDKRLRRSDIAEVVAEIQRAGIHVIANYIFGLPDDDLDTMCATLQMAVDLRTEWANFYSAMAYPGSPLYGEAVKGGWRLPETWSGYAQHGYECTPMDTRKVDRGTVLRFRDEAHNIYFSSARFQEDTARKFGPQAATHVREMVARELPRRLLQETYESRRRMSV